MDHHSNYRNIELDKTVKADGIEKEIDGKKIRYFKIASFPSLNYEFGLSDCGWIVRDFEDWYKIKFINGNFVVFLRVLELPTEKVIDAVDNGTDISENNEYQLHDFFPIKSLTFAVLKMESSYWLNLCLDYLLALDYYDNDFFAPFGEIMTDVNMDQKVRHKMRKYISRINRVQL